MTLYRLQFWLVIVPSLVAALLLGIAFARFEFGIRELVILVFVVWIAFSLLIQSRTILLATFYLWILTFALGYRSLYVTPSVNVTPGEVIPWLLAMVVAGQKLMTRQPIHWRPALEWIIFISLGGLSAMIAAVHGTNVENIANELKLILLGIPVSFLVAVLVDDLNVLATGTAVAIFAGCAIVLPLVLAVLIPGMSGLMLGLGLLTQGQARPDGFTPYGFFAWASVASFLFVPLLGLVWAHILLSKTWRRRSIYIAAGLILLLGIYDSGTRGAWFAVAAMALALIFSQIRRAFWVPIALGGFVLVAPGAFLNRFSSVFSPETWDSSALRRYDRIQQGLDLFQQSPFVGNGLGSSGWPHNDWVWMLANMGIFAALVVGIGLVRLARGLWHVMRMEHENPEYAAFGFGLLLSLIGLVFLFTFEGLFVLNIMMPAVWFILALAAQLPILARSVGGHR